jgi:hypothetical protein
VVLAVLAIAVLLFAWDRRAARAAAAELDTAPPGWADSVRIAGRMPDLGDFAVPRTDSGDGAWVVYDTTRLFRLAGVEHGYRALIGRDTANAADSTLWRALATDTLLDAWAAAARAQRWSATERLLATLPAGTPPTLLLPPLPQYGPARDAGRALVIRGLQRLQRGDRAGARADLAAATGLGAQMVRREPTYLGTLIGRAAIASGLSGWQRYGVVTGDTALASRATRLRDWATSRPGATGGLLLAAPDTAIAIASDTSLALGTRTFAMEQLLAAWFLRPRGLVFGPPARVKAALAALAADPDPDMARMGAIAVGTAARLNLFGLPALMRGER